MSELTSVVRQCECGSRYIGTYDRPCSECVSVPVSAPSKPWMVITLATELVLMGCVFMTWLIAVG